MNSDSMAAASKDDSPLSFHSARIHALQRDNFKAERDSENPPPLQAPVTTAADPFIGEVFRHLSVNSNDPLTKTWNSISQKSSELTAELAIEADLKERLALVQQRIMHLKRDINAQLQEAQQAADQMLNTATLRAEVSRLTQTKLAARLNLADPMH
jgi:hypothetical protein